MCTTFKDISGQIWLFLSEFFLDSATPVLLRCVKNQFVALCFEGYLFADTVLLCLQNVHLVARWLNSLEKKLEHAAVESHEDFRVFISAEPAPTTESHIIPQGILESSIKITNEPPTGMYANLHKALSNFNQVCRE